MGLATSREDGEKGIIDKFLRQFFLDGGKLHGKNR